MNENETVLPGADEEPEIITLQNDAGETADFVELAGIEMADGSAYVILQPAEIPEGAEDEVYVFRVDERDDGYAEYTPEESEEIIDRVLSAYDQLLAESEEAPEA